MSLPVYQILTAPDLPTLAGLVNTALVDDWGLLGDPIQAPGGNPVSGLDCVAQALTFDGTSPGDPPATYYIATGTSLAALAVAVSAAIATGMIPISGLFYIRFGTPNGIPEFAQAMIS